jgi:hypothetical protein
LRGRRLRSVEVFDVSADWLLGFDDVPKLRKERTAVGELEPALREHVTAAVVRTLNVQTTVSAGEVAAVIRRAQIILRSADGEPNTAIAESLGVRALVEKRRAWRSGQLAAIDDEIKSLSPSEPRHKTPRFTCIVNARTYWLFQTSNRPCRPNGPSGACYRPSDPRC